MNELSELYNVIAQKRAEGQKVEKDIDNLIIAFDKTIKSIINKYEYNPSDEDILMQDGRTAVLKAMYTYNDSYKAEFYTYAYTCVNHAIIDSLRRINSKKRKNVSRAATIDEKVENILPPSDEDIEENYRNKKRIEKAMSYLTKEEIEVINLMCEGYKYDEIAKKMKKKKDDIKNIINRIRNKSQSIN